jgi:hypothetical protein
MNALSSLPFLSPHASTFAGSHPAKESSGSSAIRKPATSEPGLRAEDLKKLTELKARDREVRTHEAAHQAAGGQHAGAMSLTYERGPDGAQYAVGGEVPIDVSSVAGDPQATVEKMRTVHAAALAPAEPSSQDLAVAAQAMQTLLQARAELSADKNGKTNAVAEADDSSEKDSEESAEQSDQSLSGQQANSAYRAVSALSGQPEAQQFGFFNISV